MIYGALGELALGEGETEVVVSEVFPVSILSSEAFGVPTIGADAYAMFPTEITSAEAFGTPLVNIFVIAPVEIISAEAFGVPSVIVTIIYLPHSRL